MTDEACREAFDQWFRAHRNPDSTAANYAWAAFQAAWTHLTKPVMCIHGAAAGTPCDLCEREALNRRAAWTARAGRGDLNYDYEQAAIDSMCPNCVTPYKCNGPHLAHRSPSDREAALEEAATIADQYSGSAAKAIRALMVRP